MYHDYHRFERSTNIKSVPVGTSTCETQAESQKTLELTSRETNSAQASLQNPVNCDLIQLMVMVMAVKRPG